MQRCYAWVQLDFSGPNPPNPLGTNTALRDLLRISRFASKDISHLASATLMLGRIDKTNGLFISLGMRGKRTDLTILVRIAAMSDRPLESALNPSIFFSIYLFPLERCSGNARQAIFAFLISLKIWRISDAWLATIAGAWFWKAFIE